MHASWSNGISFGVVHWASGNAYHIGPLIVKIDKPMSPDFVKQVNTGTWPKDRLFIVKYASFGTHKGKWFWEVQ